MENNLDRIDRKILSILQEDGRIANLKLAEAVALSPTAVLARVQRLTREGYILGYEARLNPMKLGAGLEQVVKATRHQVAFHDLGVYLLKTRAADMNAYRVFAGNVLWQLPGVRETRTYAVMEEVKHSNHLHLHV